VRLDIGMVVTVWAARHLGPEHFGTLSFSQAIVWMPARWRD
jgi:O-antigen/teichoic acid export membrane protein